MLWHNRYELLDPIAGAPGSFRGREKGSKNPVILHQIPVSDSFPNGLLRQINELPTQMSEHVRDVWELEGALYVVTDLHFGEVALTGWLERARGTPASSRAVPSEFTQFFLAPAPPVHDFAGEIAQPARSTEPPGPGEFTRFMSSSLAPEPMHAAQSVGELTRLFQSKPQPEPRAPEKIGVAPVPQQQPQRPVGDFTRLLGPMAGPSAFPSQGSMPQPKAHAIPVAASLPTSGSGDYTRVISARRPDPVKPAAAIPLPAEAVPPKTGGSLNPILVFSGLAVLALALILVFAIWR